MAAERVFRPAWRSRSRNKAKDDALKARVMTGAFEKTKALKDELAAEIKALREKLALLEKSERPALAKDPNNPPPHCKAWEE